MSHTARPSRAARWGVRAREGWVLALIVLVAVVTIGRPLVGLGSLHAADTLQLLDPWAQDADPAFRPDNGNVSDTVDAVAPVRLAVAQRARDGDLALWSSTQGGGAPLLGVPNTAMLSPLNLPWWLAPGHWAPALAKALQMAVAGWFLFLFGRRVGLSSTAAAVGALGFVNAGHLVVWTTWPQSNVAALVPALFWAVDRAVSSPRFVDAWPVPLVGAVLWLEGFPALALWAHVLAGAYAVVRLWAVRPRRRVVGAEVAGAEVVGGGTPASRPQDTHTAEVEVVGGGAPASRPQDTHTVRRVVAMVGAMALGVGIAAVQLVPFALRTAELDTSTRAAKAAGALPWVSMATLASPDALGQTGGGVWYGPGNEVELQAFVGVIVLLLVIVALVGNRLLAQATRAWLAFAVTAALVVSALIWVDGPFHDAVQSLPLIGGNQTGRLRGLQAFLLAGAAGPGFEVLLRLAADRMGVPDRATHGRPGRFLAGVAVGVAVVGAALTPAFVRAVDLAAEVGRGDFVRTALLQPAALLLAALAVVVLTTTVLRRTGRARVVVLALLPLLLAVESAAFARGFLPRIDTDDFYPRTAAHGVVDDLVGTDRFAATDFALYPGTTTAYGLRSLTAHASMPTAWKQLLLAADPTAFDRNATFPILAPTAEVASSAALDLLGVSHFVTAMDTPVFGRRGDEVRVDAALGGGSVVHGVDVHRDVLAMLADHDLPADLAAWLVDEDGTRTAFGARRLTGREAGEWLSVPLAPLSADGRRAPDLRPDRGTLVVALLLDPASSVPDHGDREGDDDVRGQGTSVEGGTSVPVPGTVRLRPVRVGLDGLRVVSAPDVVVYERPDALPRVRLESPTDASDDTARVAFEGGDVTAPPTLGTVELTLDTDDELAVRTESDEDTVLVVADAVSGGHLARVDGRRVEVVAAHGALVGIPVPAGAHEVTLTWQPEGLRPAAAVTVGSLLAVLALAFLATRPRPRRRSAPRA